MPPLRKKQRGLLLRLQQEKVCQEKHSFKRISHTASYIVGSIILPNLLSLP